MSRTVLDPVSSMKLGTVTAGTRGKVLALARRKKVPFDMDRAPRDGWQWNGEKVAAKGLTVSDFIHEIAHYLVCSEDRRTVKDFGLGMGPDSENSAPRKVTSDQAQTEEEQASALGITLEYSLGFDPEWTLEFHNWGNYDSTDGGAGTAKFYRALNDLQNRKIVSAHLVKRLKAYLKDWWEEAEKRVSRIRKL